MCVIKAKLRGPEPEWGIKSPGIGAGGPGKYLIRLKNFPLREY